MRRTGLFLQNIIAVIWDFDKTLSPHYMQKPLFDEYGIDEHVFWEEVRKLPDYYKRSGVHVQPDTCYLMHLLSYVQHGHMHGLTNAKLHDLGKRIEFYPGVPDILDRLKAEMDAPEFRQGDLKLEHYVVSTGITQLIRGSRIADRLNGIWASEFIEMPAPPGFDLAALPERSRISQIAGFLDNTTKTRAIFEINKGVNVEPDITVNDTIAEEDRRVPIRNMIYIADGPSDVPSFSVIRQNRGLAYAVYDPENPKQFAQVVSLHDSGRVDAFGPADYTKGSQTDMWLRLQVRRIAQRIMDERKSSLHGRVGRGPSHIDGL